MSLQGGGFSPGETVTLSMVLSGSRLSLGTTTADASGRINASVNAPVSLASGYQGGVEALGASPSGSGLLLISIIRVVESATEDTDGDGVPDICDNCSGTPNPDQHDTDRDGYGNACDADLDNNGIVNTLDLALLRNAFGRSGDALAADLDSNFVVNTIDLAMLRARFGLPPGPAFRRP
jgi:Thrombospondin type 3 repeat